MANSDYFFTHGLLLCRGPESETTEVGFGEGGIDPVVETDQQPGFFPYRFVQFKHSPEFTVACKQVLGEHIDVFFYRGGRILRQESLFNRFRIQGHAGLALLDCISAPFPVPEGRWIQGKPFGFIKIIVEVP